MDGICIRCEDSPALDELGYCGHCHSVVQAEVEEGVSRLQEYLRKWERFDAWCRDHPRAA